MWINRNALHSQSAIAAAHPKAHHYNPMINKGKVMNNSCDNAAA